MGTTRFKLFSTTGPSVAIGLAITVVAVLTLTPALLVILARIRPLEFQALSAPPSGWWEHVARTAMKRPAVIWVATVLVMAPLAVIGLRSGFVEDVLIEMPRNTPSLQDIRWLGTKFDTGELAPLTVVLESDTDLRESAGLAFIDDLSQFLAHQRGIREVRSATQPLGNTALLDPARLAERLQKVNEGQSQIESGGAPAPGRLEPRGRADSGSTLD